MHRCKDRGFCCGAGGARFWMEEKIGKRINLERTDEAIGLDPDLISTACPFCMVMLSDAVTEKKADGSAKEHVQVLDVAQILQQSARLPRDTLSQRSAGAARNGCDRPSHNQRVRLRTLCTAPERRREPAAASTYGDTVTDDEPSLLARWRAPPRAQEGPHRAR